MKKSFFGDMFDLNGDGEVDAAEQAAEFTYLDSLFSDDADSGAGDERDEDASFWDDDDDEDDVDDEDDDDYDDDGDIWGGGSDSDSDDIW